MHKKPTQTHRDRKFQESNFSFLVQRKQNILYIITRPAVVRGAFIFYKATGKMIIDQLK